MIRKLRIKFLCIAMCSVILVLGSIIAVINISNYSRVNVYADQVLSVLAENGGEFPMFFPIEPDKNNGITPETPFETRYFTVTLDKNDKIIAINTERIAGVSSETACSYVISLLDKGKTEGMYGDYKYVAISVNNGTMYIFLDCGKDLYMFRNFLWLSVFISIGALFIICLLVLLLSNLILKPVEESYHRQKSFITNASHDIKTPLTIISAQADVIELETGKSEWTDEIKVQIGRLSSLTDKLVFLSKMDEDKFKPEFNEFNLSDAVNEMVQAYLVVSRDKKLNFTIDIAENIVYLGNEDMLKQAMALILDNTVKYTEENGKVIVRLKSTVKGNELIFYNTTERINKGKCDEIFERFYRADGSRNSNTGGNGIGLAVVKAIVLAHNGSVSAYSEDGKSLKMTVIL